MQVFANWVETLHLKVITSDALQTLASAVLALRRRECRRNELRP